MSRARRIIAHLLLLTFLMGNGLNGVEVCDCGNPAGMEPVPAEAHACPCACHLPILIQAAPPSESCPPGDSHAIPAAADQVHEKLFVSEFFHPPEIPA
jgi:hypothetical protein